jgi:exopolyphosphatase/guanosine-5'-triphosphate,3'-diphosphate pyrophosphatase
MNKTRYCALDIGTNSVLLLVAAEDEKGDLQEEHELFRVTRLGEGVGESGRMNPSAIRKTLTAVSEFMAQIHREPGTRIVGLAATTSAARDAENRDEFLEPCSKLLGKTPLVLNGDEESRTVFLGATSDQPPDCPCVTVDIGGGSTEAALGTRARCVHAVSLDVGCVRFGERFGLYETADDRQIAAARQAVREHVTPVCAEIAKFSAQWPANLRLLASGGTATTFAALRRKLTKYDRHAVHGYTDTEPAVADVMQRLFLMPSTGRAALPGVTPGRAPVLPAGLLILSEFLRACGVPRFAVTTRGLRFGMVRRLQRGDIPPTWIWE